MAVRDVVQAAAGVGGGDKLYVEDVFSTYLYTGTGAAQTITNGIDLDGEGGLVWMKSRTSNPSYEFNVLVDTARAGLLISNATDAAVGSGLTTYNSDGFRINSGYSAWNTFGQNYASWTFRKAPKFFDVVTYTGDGTQNRQISHNLGSTPGCVIVKRTDSTGLWPVWHRKGDFDPSEHRHGFLNQSADFNNYGSFNNAANQSTYFTDSIFTVRNNSNVNASGGTYVAYLFAHDAGGFGDDGEQNVVSCGSYVGNSSSTGPVVNLGWEPQWVMVKNASSTGDWSIFDNMRGMPATANATQRLKPNTADTESAIGGFYPTATGFEIKDTTPSINASPDTFIYIAIRRPMKTPESGTEVFAVAPRSSTAGYNYAFVSNFPVDMGMSRNVVGATEMRLGSRLQGDAYLQTPLTSAEASSASWYQGDSMNSVGLGFSKNNEVPIEKYGWMFRRAPSVFDVVAYTGTGNTGTGLIPHNLTVAPELVIIKPRSSGPWECGTQFTATQYVYLILNATNAWGPRNYNSGYGDYSAPPTDTLVKVLPNGSYNSTGINYVAYLFSSLPGVSKVGSYTGTGADLNVDCGFSAGARFILIKRTDASGTDWYVWDSTRGIVAGNDPYLLLNSTAAQVTNTDYIDPLASGFTVTSSAPAAINASGGSYIFLAIA